MRSLFVRSSELPGQGCFPREETLLVMPLHRPRVGPARRGSAARALAPGRFAGAGGGRPTLGLHPGGQRSLFTYGRQVFRLSCPGRLSRRALAGAGRRLNGKERPGPAGFQTRGAITVPWPPSAWPAAPGWMPSTAAVCVFYPGYHSHFADTELTAIAFMTDQLIFNPMALLMEVDYEKHRKGHRQADVRLYETRRAQGFGGLVGATEAVSA